MVWSWVVEAPVSMVPARLDLGGRGYGVYGVWVSVVTVSMVSDGLDLGGRGYGVSSVWGWSGYGVCWCLLVLICVVGLWCLWCLLVLICVVRLWCLWCLMGWTWVVVAMVSLVAWGGRDYSVYGVSGVWTGVVGLWCL